MAAKTRHQAKAAKQRRQKLMAIGGSILLVIVLAIQVPRTMRMLDGGGSEPASTPASVGEATEPATDTGQPVPTPAPTAASTELPDRNAQPEPEDGHLLSFELFEAKDPFAQQVTDEAAQSAVGTSAPPPATGSATAAPAPAPATPSSNDDRASRTLSAVSIAVNGTEEQVRVSETFPSADPTFVLVSSTSDSAKVAIAGGALADGAGAVTLKLGRRLTLVNTADGSRYELELRSTR